MIKRSGITIIILMLWCIVGTSQDISSKTIRWTVNRGQDLQNNSKFDYNCSFTTNGSNSIEWSQDNGAFVSAFTISSLEGSWQDIRTNGTMTYNIAQGGSSGTLKFERKDQKVFITMEFPIGEPDATRIRFQVNQTSNSN